MRMATKPAKPATLHWTRADLARLPDDGNRYEVLDGRLLVTPQAAFGHQHVAFALARKLADYCERHGVGFVVGPGAIIFGRNELQPDVQVCPGALPAASTAWIRLPRPILVAEVLSESTRRRDLEDKRDAYLRRRKIPDYWIVDLDARLVLTWKPGSAEPGIVSDVLRWQPRAEFPPLEIRTDSLFPPRG
jgi:Uma2 family endonuclease